MNTQTETTISTAVESITRILPLTLIHDEWTVSGDDLETLVNHHQLATGDELPFPENASVTDVYVDGAFTYTWHLTEDDAIAYLKQAKDCGMLLERDYTNYAYAIATMFGELHKRLHIQAMTTQIFDGVK